MRRLSEHTRLEIAHAIHVGHRPGDAPWLNGKLLPLAEGDPVPGCSCPECTGVPADHPARRSLQRGRKPGRNGLPVDEARAVPILEVVSRLGLGEPRKAGREYLVRCPLHDDSRPSLRISPERGLWICDPCGEGGDGIRLVERVRGVSFADAVRQLIGS